MFRGVSELSLDNKGRLAIPTRHRDLLVFNSQSQANETSSTQNKATDSTVENDEISDSTHGSCIITIDTQERCLLIYPMAQWEIIEKQIEALPSFNAHARKVQRLLLGHATEVNVDSHSRLLIPPPLREFAGLEKQVVLLGQGKKLELWNKTEWDKQREIWLKEETKDGDDLPPSLMSISL